MATSNFYNKNASRVFSCLGNYDEKYSQCDCGHFWEWEEGYIEESIGVCSECNTDVIHDTEYRTPESFEYDDLVMNLQTDFQRTNGFHYMGLEKTEDGLRSYHGSIIGNASMPSKFYNGISVGVNVDIIIRSGYYEGVNLDWEINYEVDENYYSIEDIDFEWLFKKRTEQYQGWITDFLEAEAEKLIEIVEKIFTENSTPLNVIGTFSKRLFK